MKRLYVVLLFLIGLSGIALAQASISVVDSVLFKTDNANDQPLYRAFGFSSKNTDDEDDDEVSAPLPPPKPSYFMVFTDTDLGRDMYPDPLQNDIRGVPDSVANGSRKYFSIRFEIKVQRGLGQAVTVVFPQRLARGIDSINIQDLYPDVSVFNFTYGSGTEEREFTIPNNELEYMFMTVYYNLFTASVGMRPDIAQNMQLFPNPTRPGQSVTFTGDAPTGAQVMVSDLLGRVVETHQVSYPGERLQLNLESAPAGVYMVSLLGNEGEVLYHRQLMLVH